MRPIPAMRLAYHQQTLDYLKHAEPELWRWFSSTACQDEFAKTARLELLKSCYRFERADAGDLYALCDEVAATAGVAAPVTLYQSQSGDRMNMMLAYMPDEAHIVFEGPVRTTLTRDELRSTIAHELAHYALWQEADGEMLIADQMLAAMASHPAAQPSHLESARLFRLYTEIYADRGALAACGDPLTAIAALIKVGTGVTDVNAESYVRQATEVFAQADVKAEELTHPESYIRAWALNRWAGDPEHADADIRRVIEGRLDIDRLSLLGQDQLTRMTRRLLFEFFGPRWLRTDVLLAHARLFFTDFNPDVPPGDAPRGYEEALKNVSDSTERYVSYVLLDLATVDRQFDDAPLVAALRLAEKGGIEERFGALLTEELGLSRRAISRLRKEGHSIMEKAARSAGEPA